jgi:hypothetical protein
MRIRVLAAIPISRKIGGWWAFFGEPHELILWYVCDMSSAPIELSGSMPELGLEDSWRSHLDHC